MAQIAPRVKNQDLYPIAVLIDELKHEDVQTRLNAVRQLEHIAITLGPSRTRNELIPFLMESVDEDDVILAATAEKLGSMVDAVGGADFASVLIRPLEDLLMLEESTIRENALSSIRKILSVMPTRHVEEHCLPLVLRLSTNDWFVARSAACTLIPEVAHLAFTDELLRAFIELCGDDTPMVRRAALSALPAFAKETPTGKQRDLLDALRRLARDDQDSVRILTLPAAMSLATDVFPNPNDSFNALFPEIRSCVDDPSWRVRVTVAESIDAVIKHTPQKNQTQVFDMYVKLLGDQEAEVRSVAVARLPMVCAFRADRTLLNILTPPLNKLAKDDSEQVRCSFAEALTKTCPVFGTALTAESLVQFLLKALRDTSTSVRTKVIANLEHISGLLKLDELTPCLMPAVMELATDRQWRVRLSVLEYTGSLVKALGKELFTEDLLPVTLRWLCDPVYKVREAAAENLGGLVRILGTEYSKSHIVPQITDLSCNSNYLYRMTALMAVITLSREYSSREAEQQLLPIVLSLVGDGVANVRFNVANALKILHGKVSKKVGMESVIPGLKTLTKDGDKDVQFFAKDAIDSLIRS
jgi:serine/threonine-protein phosphatase 2A regulatory subunit A